MKKTLLFICTLFCISNSFSQITISGAGSTSVNITTTSNIGPYNGADFWYFNSNPQIWVVYNYNGTGQWEIVHQTTGSEGVRTIMYVNPSNTAPAPPSTGWVSYNSNGLNPAPMLCGPGVEASPDCATLSINESKIFDKLNVYPNPTNGVISIDGIKGGNIKITDLQGKIVLESIIDNDNSIDISKQRPGVYLLIIETENITFHRKIIKL
ncbi:T9SS type A sorting domain-containing protein [Lacinutrix sp. C3R15]|uniref:T9SS type A sorting domain-containing protein n=1 Tax=Flavobacteriaceae TaxID=49546 RepID=UPI001C09ED3A|nr:MULTISPECIES: T9SS type A sorting domain-containing protein [Flavobacteriaceae]MBU2938420.1 T9SS type A sorting domain-containing protein [Lacinutrix sp. C3R15]MDO6621734.1 T9SS type A sorting domain-containing protein [Oceanihabitans sp. 1_MG-2023]